MANLLIDLEVDRIDLVDEGADSAAFIKLYKRKERDTAMEYKEVIAKLKPEHAEVIEQEIEKAKTDASAELEDIKKELNDVKKELESTKAATEKTQEPEDNLEDVIKNMDESTQKIFKSLQTQKEAAEKVAKELSDKKAHEEAVKKAAELKALPVEEERLIEVVKSASDDVYDVLKSAAKAIDDGAMFEEIGKKGGDSTDAWDKIEKKAKEIAERDNTTVEKAVYTVINENPKLYDEYLNGGAN